MGPLSSENALFLECLPHRDNFRIVNEQQRDRHAADLSPGLQLRHLAPFQMDRIAARQNGGATDLENLARGCIHCNGRLAAKPDG